MIAEIVYAFIFGALPVAVFTFLVLQGSIAAGRLQPFADQKALEKQFKDHKKAEKAAKANADQKLFSKRPRSDFFHSKVMFFGGGFYGTMALFTYAIIEIEEIVNFLAVVFTPDAWFVNLGWDLIIGFIINSITNIVAAFVWFMTLPDYVDVTYGFVWIVAAYAGYMLGLKLVMARGGEIWERLLSTLGQLQQRIKADRK